MTRKTNARIAGYAFIIYIAAGILSMVLAGRSRGGAGMAAKLASVSEHSTLTGITVLLTFVMAFAAFWLGVSLYALTKDEDPMIPAPLAWLGLVGSVILMFGLPIQLAGFFSGMATQLMWIPVALFELAAAPWLIIKGAAAPTRRQPA